MLVIKLEDKLILQIVIHGAEIGYTEAQAISGDQVTAMAITLTTAVIQGTGANGSTFTLTPCR